MRKSFTPFILLTLGLLVFGCKKDAQKQAAPTQDAVLHGGFSNFSADGQLIPAQVDSNKHIITVVLPRTTNMQQVAINFTLSNQVTAAINGNSAQNGVVVDFTKPETMKLTAQDGKSSASYQLLVETDLQFFGLSGNIVAANSQLRDYDFYMDQFDGSIFQNINCGPASTSMALKWADSTFTGTPAYARTIYEPLGGEWYTGDVEGYLRQNNIKFVEDTLSDLPTVVKGEIDDGNVLIFCLNMEPIQQNGLENERVGKFYNGVIGHFILVKGYVQTDSGFYLECYDPYSEGARYSLITPGQLKGKDRYYIDYDVTMAAKNWWPYAIAVAPKGKASVHSGKTTSLGARHAAWQSHGR